MRRSLWLCMCVLLVLLPSTPAQVPPASSTQGDLERPWADLAGTDAASAYRAIWALTQTPRETAAFFEARLPAAAAPDARQLEQWIKDLNSDRFAVREKANRELEKLGELAEPALRSSRKGSLPLEARQRVEKLLAKLGGPISLPEQLRAVRAVETLEYIGAGPAHSLLEKYAAGAPGARLTKEATEALKRLRSHAVSPATPKESRQGTDLYGDPMPAAAVARLGTIRFRSSSFGMLAGFAWLPDSKTLLTARGQQVQLWEAPGGRLLRDLEGEPFQITAFALTPDGKRFAVAGVAFARNGVNQADAGEIRVYDIASGKVTRRFSRANRQDIFSAGLAFSPDSQRLFSLGYAGILRVEEISSGKEVLQKNFRPANFRNSDISGLSMSVDGKYLAIATRGPLYLWDWQNAAPQPLKAPEYGTRGLSFSPDGKLLAGVADINGTLHVWQVPNGRLLYQQAHPDDDFSYTGTPVFTPDGKSLAVFLGRRNGRVGGKTQLLDPSTGRVQATFAAAGGRLAISGDSQRLAVSYGQGVRIWDLPSRQEITTTDAGHSSAPTRIVVSLRGIVVTAGDDQSVRLWDSTSRQRHKFLADGWVRDISLSPDGKLLAASSLDDLVHVWETGSGREIYRLAGHGQLGGRRTLGFFPDGRGFLSWGDDFYLRLWNVKNGKALLEHPIRPSGVTIPDENNPGDKRRFEMQMGQAAISADAKTLVLDIAGNFYLFDTNSGTEGRKFASRGGFYSPMVMSPDGRCLLVSTQSPNQPNLHHVDLWDLSNGKLLQQHLIPGSSTGPVAFAPDGRSFATSVDSPQAGIVVYEAGSGKVRCTIRGFPGQVRSLAFYPDGARLASGLTDSTVLVWDLAQAAALDKGR